MVRFLQLLIQLPFGCILKYQVHPVLQQVHVVQVEPSVAAMLLIRLVLVLASYQSATVAAVQAMWFHTCCTTKRRSRDVTVIVAAGGLIHSTCALASGLHASCMCQAYIVIEVAIQAQDIRVP